MVTNKKSSTTPLSSKIVHYVHEKYEIFSSGYQYTSLQVLRVSLIILFEFILVFEFVST